MDNIAQQTTLTKGVEDIREDISHISIDTSDLAKEATTAKQGNNPSATNTAILAACNPNIATNEDVDAFLDTVLIDYE